MSGEIKVNYLLFDELRALLKGIDAARCSSPEQKRRHRLMVLVSFWHCLRASEVVGMTASNIRDGYIRVKRLKDSDDCNQPYVDLRNEPELADLDEYAGLDELSRTLKPRERLFPMTRIGFYNLMQRAGKLANLPLTKRHPHVLKHTGVMVAIKDGVHYARTRAGHRSLSSTGHYLDVHEDKANRAFKKTALMVKKLLEE